MVISAHTMAHDNGYGGNTLGWSARVRWQISPGNEVFLVYNKNWERRWDPISRFAPLEDRGVIKISLSMRP